MPQYHIQNEHISIVVDSHGAELQSLKKGSVEYLYQKQLGFWQRQSPILFPIVGSLKGGVYEYEGVDYALSQHGFARDMEWECRVQDDNVILCVLRSTSETLVQYPFEFELTLSYTLHESTLYVEYSLMNPSTEIPLFASLGAHPAFALSAPISEYSLRFPQDDELIVDRLELGLIATEQRYQLEDHRLSLSEGLFVQDAMICRHLRTTRIELYHRNELHFVFDRASFPHLGIWKQADSPFLCIEPWHGHADPIDATGNLLDKPGIFALEPYESRDFAWFIKI